MILAFALVAAVWFSLVLPPLAGRTRPTARATTAAPAASAVATPRTPAERRLMASPLYAEELHGTCPAQSSPDNVTEFHEQVQALITCLEDAYRPALTKAGFQVEKVRVRFYQKQTTSPCGESHDDYAFYCEENQTIYLSKAVYTDSGDNHLSVAEVVSHEYGHHVQSMAGILSAGDDWYDSSAVRQRTELQVLCWTDYTLTHVDGFNPDSDDLSWLEELWSYAEDAEGHGSAEAQQRWGPRGLQGENLGACNTWNVSADEVP